MAVILGTIAHWSFEGDSVIDEEAGLAGILTGNAVIVAEGEDGDGVDLDGTNSGIEIAHDPSLALAEGSFSIWVNPDTVFAAHQGILSKDARGYFDGGHIGVMIEWGGQILFRMQDTGATYQILSDVAIAAGEWSHITVTWGAEGMQLYINGVLAGTNDYTGGIEANTEPLLLGANQWGSQEGTTAGANDFLDGQIDGFGVYDHQITAAEIADVMAGVEIPNEAPTLEAPLDAQAATEEAAFTFDVPETTFADADGDTLTLTAALADGSDLPAWLAFDGTTFSGTPDDADVGALDVVVTASDGRETVDATFTLTVGAVNDAPIATDDTLGLEGALTGDIDVLANDTDADDETLSVTAIDGTAIAAGETVTLASGATVTLNIDGTLTYGNSQGVDDTFTYTASDDEGASADANVEVLALAPPPPPPPPPSTSVAEFAFEEGAGTTTLDPVGGLQGLLTGTASFVADGQTGFGIDLPGNSGVEIAHDASLELPEGSFSIWVNPDGVNGRQGILSKDARGYFDGGHIGVMIDGGLIRFRMQDTGQTYEIFSDVAVTAGEWTHVTVTWGADGMQLFVNGVLAGTNTDYTGGIELNTEPLLLGANQWGAQAGSTQGANDYLNGQLDGFAIHDHQLTAAEIADVMAGVVTPNEPPLLEAAIAAQTATEEAAFSFDVPAGTFSDADGNVLTLTATLADGSDLPTWLTFDGTTFSGTPDDADVGAIDVTVVASDGRETAETTFTLTVDAVNDAPVATDDALGLDGALTGDIDVLANDTDVDDAALSVTAIDGTAIATGETVTLASGATVTLNVDGTLTYANGTGADDAFTYTASDDEGASADATVDVTAGALPPPPPPPPPPADTGAVAFFNFEEGAGATTLDTQGNLQGQLTGTASFIADGQDGFGIDNPGQGSGVEIAHDASMELTEGSFAIWINPDGVNGRQGILSKDARGYFDGGHIGVMIDGGLIRFRMQDTGQTYEIFSNVAVAANEWTHVAVTWGAEGMQLFVNGELAGTNTDYTGGIEMNTEPLLLGANQWGSQEGSTAGANDYFNGQLDSFGMFDFQLTSEDVADLIDGFVPSPVNRAPIIDDVMDDIGILIGQPVSVTIPEGLFVDPDNDALTITATLADGSALPAWLTFDGTTFAGTAPEGAPATLDITLTASDGELETTYDVTANIDAALTLDYSGTTTSHAVDLELGLEGEPLSIMPIGDSISVGTRSNINDTDQSELGGYRDDLFHRLAENGLLVDYVGDYGSAPSDSGLLDGSHQAVGGRKSARVRDDLTVKTTEHNADIVLLMVGTNDATYDNDVALFNYPNQMENMIAELFAANPDVHLFVATIPPVQPDETISGGGGPAHQAIIDQLNDWLRDHVAELQAAGNTNIHLVDMAAVLDPDGDISTTDIDSGVHATDQGYAKMADMWYDAIVEVFGETGPTLGETTEVAWNAVDVIGGDAMDMLIGNSWNNTLNGGNGNDWLDGGEGDDILIGGNGIDVFVMSAGNDTVLDFSAGNDQLDISMTSITTLAEFLANSVEVGTSLVFTDPETGATITLGNTSFEEMSEDNILFRDDYPIVEGDVLLA